MSNTDAAGKQLDIRKYPNRRYYDATHSKHLTLDQIRDLVRDGYDIKVTDSKTGADITAQLLTQIILELETPKLDTFPVAMLVQMIRANERAVGDFIQKHFSQAFAAYMDYQKQLEERFRQMHGVPEAFAPLSAWTQAMFSPFGGPQAKNAPPGPEKPQKESREDLAARFTELQQQVAALKEELKKKKPKTKRKKR
jgi:polyhydroxyalkanoate synthesis repressor PhaR